MSTATSMPYPEHLVNDVARGVATPVPVGYVHGSNGPSDLLATVNVSQNVLITGRRNSGTTNTIGAIALGLLNRDVVLWAIDTEQHLGLLARGSQPATDQPPISRWAVTDAAALHLATAAVRVIAARRDTAWGAIDNFTPALVILVPDVDVDHGDGPARRIVRRLLQKIALIGPAVGVHVILHVHEATADSIGSHELDCYGARIALAPTAAEVFRLFGSENWPTYGGGPAAQAAKEANQRGVGAFRPAFYQGMDVATIFHVTGDRAAQVAAATAARRPELDETSRIAGADTPPSTVDHQQRFRLALTLRASIRQAGDWGKSVEDLIEEQARLPVGADVALIRELLEQDAAAGVLARHPNEPDRYVVAENPGPPRELGSVALPCSVRALAQILEGLAREYASAGWRGAARPGRPVQLTTDHLDVVTAADGTRRLVVFTEPVRARVDAPPELDDDPPASRRERLATAAASWDEPLPPACGVESDEKS